MKFFWNVLRFGVPNLKSRKRSQTRPVLNSILVSEHFFTVKLLARSTASSSEINSVVMPATDWPGVDGISAGRSAAIGALCRIICSKNSQENLSDLQLAQFYKVIHEALQEVCVIIFAFCRFSSLYLKSINSFCRSDFVSQSVGNRKIGNFFHVVFDIYKSNLLEGSFGVMLFDILRWKYVSLGSQGYRSIVAVVCISC